MLPKTSVRALAFYLPQFHPVPENDQRWGTGFTEWTNVTKATPLFRDHYQPNLPSDLGFYDLRVPETREAQASLARMHGIEGFVYWHYWFGEGRRILERVFSEVLESGKPDFPFCLAWANESWTGIWHGLERELMIEQKYPGIDDHKAHFQLLCKAFKDPRYIKVNGKPLFVIYRPLKLPDANSVLSLWQDLARKNGFPGIYFAGVDFPEEKRRELGFDARIPGEPLFLAEPDAIRFRFPNETTSHRFKKRINRLLKRYNPEPPGPTVASYKMHVNCYLKTQLQAGTVPCVLPNWDNTPRSGPRGYLFDDATPELYQLMLKKSVKDLQARPPQERLLFIKSWNEWAEGNYLEPSRRYGRRYLEATLNGLSDPN